MSDHDGDMVIQQAVRGEGGGVCLVTAGAQGGPINGDPIQENVLASTDRAYLRHSPDRHADHLGAHGETRGYRPTGPRPARLPQTRLKRPAGVVELDNAAGISVHLVHASKEYVEHLFQESLREYHLEALEKRRPRIFGGMGARLDRDLTLRELAQCATEPDKPLLRGVLAGVVWTADRAHCRGLRQNDRCPYCDKGPREDEDHLLWWSEAWKAVRDPFLPDLMLLAQALKLGVLSEWPPCLRFCGLLLEAVVKRSALARRPGWKKRCKELNRVSRHLVRGPGEDPTEACRQRAEPALLGHQWAHDDQNPLEQFMHQLHRMFLAIPRAKMQQEEEACLLFPVEQRKVPQECYPWHQLQPPYPTPCPTDLPELGQLPRDWKWGPDFLPAMLCWLSELQWLLRDDSLPETHRQVSFLGLALDFESHAGRPLQPTPQTQFVGREMSLQEKGRVIRLAASLLGRAAGRESILPAGFTNRCRSLVPLGAGTTAGVEGGPIFTRPAAVWHHLRRLQHYSSTRWARQQRARVARQQHKRKCAQGAQPTASGGQSRKERCPGKRGSEAIGGSVRMRFLCGPGDAAGSQKRPAIPGGQRGGRQSGCSTLRWDGVVYPAAKSTVARRPEQRPRLPRLWICAAHQHRQCASCAAVGRGVRHWCARGHVGHPRLSTAMPGPRGGERRVAARTPGAGGTPSAKRHTQQQAQPLGARREQLHKRGRVGTTPPPPGPRGRAYGRRAPHGMEEQGRR